MTKRRHRGQRQKCGESEPSAAAQNGVAVAVALRGTVARRVDSPLSELGSREQEVLEQERLAQSAPVHALMTDSAVGAAAARLPQLRPQVRRQLCRILDGLLAREASASATVLCRRNVSSASSSSSSS